MLQLVSLAVRNFRALKEGSVDFEESTVIIGENGAGISTLLEAICLTLNPALVDALPAFNAYHFHFSGADGNGERKLTIVLRLALTDRFRGGGVDGLDLFPGLEIESAGAAPLYDFRFESVLTPTGPRSTWCCTHVESGESSDDPGLLRRVRELMPIVRLQPGALTRYDAVGPLHGRKGEVARLQEEIRRYAAEILQGRTLNLSASVEAGFESVRHLVDRLRVDQPASPPHEAEALTLRQLLQMVSSPDTGASDPLAHLDDFSKRLGALLLVNALLISSLVDRDVNAAPLLILEAPETQLHTRTLATVGTLISGIPWQKILTTNSGWLLGSVPFDSIRRIRRKDGRVRCHRIKSRRYSTEDLRRIAYHLRIQNNTACFARFWILVEGETEFWILPHLARIMGYNLIQEGIAVLQFAQAGLKPIIKFARDLDIGWHVLLDDDTAGSSYRQTIEGIVGKKKARRRTTRLGTVDIERFFWNQGFEHIYGGRAKASGSTEKPKPRATINRAIKQHSKPYLALRIIEEISATGRDRIPVLLADMVESCIERAKNH